MEKIKEEDLFYLYRSYWVRFSMTVNSPNTNHSRNDHTISMHTSTLPIQVLTVFKTILGMSEWC